MLIPREASSSLKISKVNVSSRLPLLVATVTLKSSMVYRRLGEANFGVWGITPLIRVTLAPEVE